MGIRDRIRGLGLQAANAVLDRLGAPIGVPTGSQTTSGPTLGTADETVGFGFDAPSDLGAQSFEYVTKSEEDPTGGSLPKHVAHHAQRQTAPIAMPPEDEALLEPKGLYWDPFALVEQLGFKERPSAITYATLSAMVWKVPIINAIVQTRINQLSSFATPQRTRFDTGFRVRLRNQEAKPTKQDKLFMDRMERMLITTGASEDPRGRDSFETFLRKLARDSLVYDQTCFEIVPGRDGRPAEWYAVDAATIRLADTYRLYPDDDPDRIKTVQIYDQVVIAEFAEKELAFGVRNPRSDIRAQGYGTSELEMLISTVTHILWGLNYNANFFAQGSVSKGLLNLKGAIPEKQLRAFRRQWYQMISGVENAWRTPIVNAEDIQWINMHASNRDMEFSAWIDFLIKVTCAVYQMDPIEVNFKYGSAGQRAMFGAADRAKLVESKDKGLKPVLRHFSRLIDKYIVWPINPEFMLEFVGLESQTPKEVADLNTQRVRTIYTIDEIRAENDLPPLPDGLGAVILDPNWMLARKTLEDQRAAQEAAQQAQAMAAAGVPGLEQSGQPPMPGGAPSGLGGAPSGGAPPGGEGAPHMDAEAGSKPATPGQKQQLRALLAAGKEDGDGVRKSAPLVLDLRM